MFIPVPMWGVLLICLIGALGTVGFGVIVKHKMEGGQRAGFVGEAVLGIVSFPWLIKDAFVEEKREPFLVKKEFERPDHPGGMRFEEGFKSENYILRNRFDGDIRENVTEIVGEGDGSVVARWVWDKLEPFEFEVKSAHAKKIGEDPSTRIGTHPILTDDGDLVVHFTHSPLYKVDSCGEVQWINNDFVFHHSLEQDAEGNFWVPGIAFEHLDGEGWDDELKDDHLVQVSPDGRTLFSKSVIEILVENELINRMYVYDRYEPDPIHLNDVQPVLETTKYWQKGDVFLSLAHLNMLMLYRPSQNTLLWWTQDLMMHQHDVDVIDESRIMVFNNNRTTRSDGDLVIGSNEMLIFDLAEGSVIRYLAEAFKREDVRTVNQGLADRTPDGGLVVEDTNSGRLLRFDAEGDLQWDYLNRAENGNAYVLSWFRYVTDKAAVETAVKKHEVCNAQS